MMVLLIPSYFMGWKLADDFNIYESKRNSCYSLNPDKVECEFNYKILTKSDDKERFHVMNKLLEQKMGLFSNDKLNSLATHDQNVFYDNLNLIEEEHEGFGKIIKINGKTSNEINISNDPLITIFGWMENDTKQTVDYLYILSNDNPLVKISNFDRSLENFETDERNNDSFWEITFLSGYLEEECNNLSIIGFKDGKKILVEHEVLVCKT